MSYRSLSDLELRDRFTALIVGDRRWTAQIVGHLEEIDRRELWAADGFTGVTSWCIERYGMSRSQAGKRVRAARLSRRFPLLLEMLARGEIHLGTINIVGIHLTEENHRELLARAAHKTEDELELMVAALAPKPDVAARVTPLRVARASSAPVVGMTPMLSTTAQAAMPRSAAPVVKALSPDRYKVQLTIGGATRDKLREVKDLMAHTIPNGDLEAIFDRALDALLEEVRRSKTAATKRPRKTKGEPSARSRSVPAEVKRAVWQRDGSACGFVSSEGRRCGSRRMLEIHHVTPFAKGGSTTLGNLELRCRAHNQYEANRDYGRGFMIEKRRSARTAGSGSRRTSEVFGTSGADLG